MSEDRDEMREKHHRMPREFYIGKIFVSFTLCVRDDIRIFTSQNLVASLVDILATVVHKRRCAAPVYCFMPEHLHLTMEGKSDDSDLWAAAVEFKQRSGYWLYGNKSPGRWQKDFHDHIIRKYEDLKAHILYSLENPVRRGIVSDWRQYPSGGCIGYKSLDGVISLL